MAARPAAISTRWRGTLACRLRMSYGCTARAEYTVYFLGFQPGFRLPRRHGPAARDAASQAAAPRRVRRVGGNRRPADRRLSTGLSPGGWQLIGRTSLSAVRSRTRSSVAVAARRCSPVRERRRRSVIAILKPAVQTTVQDLGRCGLRHLGVGRSGAPWTLLALAIGNYLVGNTADAAGLELCMPPARIRLDATAPSR
jgi:hypothetical protein